MAAPDREILEAYRDAGRSRAETARLLGVSDSAVRKWCRVLGIEWPNAKGGDPPRWPQLHDPEWMRAQIEAGRSWADVDRELGCAKGTTKSAAAVLRRRGHDIPTRPAGFAPGGSARHTPSS